MTKPPEKSDSILREYDPESPIATELRRIYHNVLTISPDKGNKSFLVTSSVEGEGKSTIIGYLAITVAQFAQRKVLLVDADLRRPRIHSIFGVENEAGMHECLAGVIDPLKAVKKTVLPNLDVIPAGARAKAPSALFESEGLSTFFEKVKFYYDIVLVDSAPVLAVSDTLFLCSEVKGVLFVVLAGVTPKEVVKRAAGILEESNANVLGAIVNNAAGALPYYYDHKYYSYHNQD
jgi:capsular exopolysaccharide synthesis family protein